MGGSLVKMAYFESIDDIDFNSNGPKSPIMLPYEKLIQKFEDDISLKKGGRLSFAKFDSIEDAILFIEDKFGKNKIVSKKLLKLDQNSSCNRWRIYQISTIIKRKAWS